MDFSHELIMVIMNEGYSDTVMDAARSAGAGGGTVLHLSLIHICTSRTVRCIRRKERHSGQTEHRPWEKTSIGNKFTPCSSILQPRAKRQS